MSINDESKFDENEQLRKQAIYNQAEKLRATGRKDKLTEAKRIYESLEGWNDSDEKAIDCENTLNGLIKTRKLIMYGIIAVAVLVIGLVIYQSVSKMNTITNLANYGLEKFKADELEKLQNSLRQGGIEDIEIRDVRLVYGQEDYKEGSKTLCGYIDYTLYSEDIDYYYTQDENDIRLKSFASVLQKTKSQYKDEQFTYTMDGVGEVEVLLQSPGYHFEIESKDNHTYKFDYHYSDEIYIDDKLVYKDDESKKDDTNSSVSSGSSSRHVCIVDGCYNTATHMLDGTSGIEWYCDEHYEWMENFANEIMDAADGYSNSSGSHSCAICGKSASYEDPYDKGTWYCYEHYNDAIEWYLKH